MPRADRSGAEASDIGEKAAKGNEAREKEGYRERGVITTSSGEHDSQAGRVSDGDAEDPWAKTEGKCEKMAGRWLGRG